MRDDKKHKLNFRLTDDDRSLLLNESPKFIEALMLLNNGHSYTDVAEILNLPIGTVKSRVNRIRRRLVKRRASASVSGEPANA